MKNFEFKSLIRECISELIAENKNRSTIRESFTKMIRDVILEVKKKKFNKSNDVGQEDKAYAGLRNVGDKKEKALSNDEILKDVTELAQGSYKSANVFWDDHRDLNVCVKDRFHIRINLKFENNYDVNATKNSADRIYAIGLTYKQLKDFIKTNLDKLDEPDYVSGTYKKALDNTKDQTNKKFNVPIKSKKVKEKSVQPKEQQKDVKNQDDLPDKPMADVGEFSKQSDHKVEKPTTKVTDKKPKEDSDLTVNLKK